MRKILINADVVTMEELNNITAILIENGKIKKVGTDEEILELKKELDIVEDMQGKCILPAFLDIKYKNIIFLDGKLDEKKAWMQTPYEGEINYLGFRMYTDAELKEIIEKTLEKNLQVIACCNGDAAAEQLIKIYEGIQIKKNTRPVILNAYFLSEGQMERIKKNHIMLSFSNENIYYNGEEYIKNLGSSRANNICNAKNAIKYKVPFTFCNSVLEESLDIINAIHCAVNRTTKNNVRMAKENEISVYEALKAVTINAAYQCFLEEERGSIKEGKLAKFVVLSENPLKVEKKTIKNIEILDVIL